MQNFSTASSVTAILLKAAFILVIIRHRSYSTLFSLSFPTLKIPSLDYNDYIFFSSLMNPMASLLPFLLLISKLSIEWKNENAQKISKKKKEKKIINTWRNTQYINFFFSFQACNFLQKREFWPLKNSSVLTKFSSNKTVWRFR